MQIIDFNKSVVFKCIADNKIHQFSNVSAYVTYRGQDIDLETDFGDFEIRHVYDTTEDGMYKCDKIIRKS